MCRPADDAPADDDAGKPATVAARVGDRFTVRLESNPTTGYRWRLVAPPEPAVASLADSAFERADTGTTGSGGEEVWSFVAAGAGRTRIVLEYARPWERDAPPLRTHQVDVQVTRAAR
jgi:inhibitor of cysteine peptidase